MFRNIDGEFLSYVAEARAASISQPAFPFYVLCAKNIRSHKIVRAVNVSTSNRTIIRLRQQFGNRVDRYDRNLADRRETRAGPPIGKERNHASH